MRHLRQCMSDHAAVVESLQQRRMRRDHDLHGVTEKVQSSGAHVSNTRHAKSSLPRVRKRRGECTFTPSRHSFSASFMAEPALSSISTLQLAPPRGEYFSLHPEAYSQAVSQTLSTFLFPQTHPSLYSFSPHLHPFR